MNTEGRRQQWGVWQVLIFKCFYSVWFLSAVKLLSEKLLEKMDRRTKVKSNPGIPLVACAFWNGSAAGSLHAASSINTHQLHFRGQHGWTAGVARQTKFRCIHRITRDQGPCKPLIRWLQAWLRTYWCSVYEVKWNTICCQHGVFYFEC